MRALVKKYNLAYKEIIESCLQTLNRMLINETILYLIITVYYGLN